MPAVVVFGLVIEVVGHGGQGYTGRRRKESLESPRERGWVKVKNRNYWRRDAGRDAARKHERRVRSSSTGEVVTTAGSQGYKAGPRPRRL
jgi:hypothetical protein